MTSTLNTRSNLKDLSLESCDDRDLVYVFTDSLSTGEESVTDKHSLRSRTFHDLIVARTPIGDNGLSLFEVLLEVILSVFKEDQEVTPGFPR